MRKRQNQRTPSSPGVPGSATFSPWQGEKGLREALENRFDKSSQRRVAGQKQEILRQHFDFHIAKRHGVTVAGEAKETGSPLFTRMR